MAALQNWQKSTQSSLFERIQQTDDPDNYTESDVVSSIKRNLNRILNERPGSCQSAKSLGVIDLNDATMSTNELNSLICTSIRQCIEDYEPRISTSTIVAKPNYDDPLTLVFSVTAYIDNQKIEFDIKLDHQQKYKLF